MIHVVALIFSVLRNCPESNRQSRILIRGSHGPLHSSLCYITVSVAWMNTVLVIMYGDYANSVMRRQVQLNPSSFCSVALLCDHTECSLRWHRAHTLRV